MATSPASPALTGDQRLDALARAALRGARALRNAGSAGILKPDGTPQTMADLASDGAIRLSLAADLPGVAIVSEEGAKDLPDGFAERPFILVDPLDGTREYIEDHPDHAVCVALIEGRRPVAAAIAAPALRKLWTAGSEALEFDLAADLTVPGGGRPVRARAALRGGLRLVTSRARPDPVALAMLETMPGASVRPVGAVLKLVAVATGDACLFPAGNPSSEWDIAAGEALVRAAGGAMLAVSGEPILYGDAASGFRHPPYAAGATEEIVRRALAQWPAN
jgi:3'(2'), 5'-bisphosphate nucleotidase